MWNYIISNNMREEIIKIVDKNIIEKTENGKKYTVDINTTGNTPRRTKLKEEIYIRKGVDVDAMADELPGKSPDGSVEIGKVKYYSSNKIYSVELEEWVINKYAL